jgi:hypothetical protein
MVQERARRRRRRDAAQPVVLRPHDPRRRPHGNQRRQPRSAFCRQSAGHRRASRAFLRRHAAGVERRPSYRHGMRGRPGAARAHRAATAPAGKIQPPGDAPTGKPAAHAPASQVARFHRKDRPSGAGHDLPVPPASGRQRADAVRQRRHRSALRCERRVGARGRHGAADGGPSRRPARGDGHAAPFGRQPGALADDLPLRLARRFGALDVRQRHAGAGRRRFGALARFHFRRHRTPPGRDGAGKKPRIPEDPDRRPAGRRVGQGTRPSPARRRGRGGEGRGRRRARGERKGRGRGHGGRPRGHLLESGRLAHEPHRRRAGHGPHQRPDLHAPEGGDPERARRTGPARARCRCRCTRSASTTAAAASCA